LVTVLLPGQEGLWGSVVGNLALEGDLIHLPQQELGRQLLRRRPFASAA
jgi:hypothetical protein